MELNHLVPAIYQQIAAAPLSPSRRPRRRKTGVNALVVGAHDPRQGGHEGRPYRDGIGRECPDIKAFVPAFDTPCADMTAEKPVPKRGLK
jgi:hypothetical protein